MGTPRPTLWLSCLALVAGASAAEAAPETAAQSDTFLESVGINCDLPPDGTNYDVLYDVWKPLYFQAGFRLNRSSYLGDLPGQNGATTFRHSRMSRTWPSALRKHRAR